MKLVLDWRNISLIFLIVTSLVINTASAEPLVVTGFTKIVDGTDDVPEAAGEPNPVDNFRDDYFFPPSPTYQELSHDGVNTAFIGCTNNTTDSDCQQNKFGLYYGDGTNIYYIRNFENSNGVPYSASMGGDTVSWLECFVSFGCDWRAGVGNLATDTASLLQSGYAWPITSPAGDFITWSFNNSVRRYDVALNQWVTIAGPSTVWVDEDTFFSKAGANGISGNRLAFTGEGNSGAKGVFTNDNSDNVITIASTSMTLPEKPSSSFTDFASPVISATDVVFVGFGSGGEHRVYRNNGSINMVLFSFAELGITPMPFIDFNGDTVIFGDAGATNKIYLWNDGDLTLAIQAGDSLDGKTVADLNVPRRTLGAASFGFQVRFTDGSAAIYVAGFAPAVADVAIDVPGTLHPHHDGSPSAVAGLNDVIDVVVFGSSIANGDTEDFVANQINPATLNFGPAEASINPESTPVFDMDVDSDGDNDAQFEFLTGDAGLACVSTEATLTGETNSGEMFQGTGSISTNCDALCHN